MKIKTQEEADSARSRIVLIAVDEISSEIGQKMRETRFIDQKGSKLVRLHADKGHTYTHTHSFSLSLSRRTIVALEFCLPNTRIRAYRYDITGDNDSHVRCGRNKAKKPHALTSAVIAKALKNYERDVTMKRAKPWISSKLESPLHRYLNPCPNQSILCICNVFTNV